MGAAYVPRTVALITLTSMVCPFAGEDTTKDTSTGTHGQTNKTYSTYIHTVYT